MKQSILLLLLCASLGIKSQVEPCDHSGCTIMDAGRYKIELSGCNTFIDIYVYDRKLKSLSGVEIRGKVEFHYIDESTLTAELEQYHKTNSLRAKIPTTGFYNCRVTIVINGVSYHAYFENVCQLRVQVK